MTDQSPTLGRELQRFRARRGMSQFDLAVCMEWKGTNPLIQIEKDRRLPKPETIDKLGECLGLNYLELHYLNGLAGYIPQTRLPPAHYVIDTLSAIGEVFKTFDFPAYVVDYQFRFWLANAATALLFAGDSDVMRAYFGRPLHAFDLVFDRRLWKVGGILNVDAFQQDQVFRFKASNAFRQHEPFFRAYPDGMDYLAAEDYARFRALWAAVDINQLSPAMPVQAADFYNHFETGDFRIKYPGGTVAYHARVNSVLHLGDLFSTVMLVPVASRFYPDNTAVAERVRQELLVETGDVLRVWDFMDVARLY